MDDLDHDQALACLRWLVEAGADEALADMPKDRLTAKAAPIGAAPNPVSDLKPKSDNAKTTPVRGFSDPTPSRAGDVKNAAELVSLSTSSGAARALAASCTNLAELKAALESFEGSELKRLATSTVFADGNPHSRIMLIGEAPGRDEDIKGLPFVGRAGKLLDLMLGAIGLDRTKVYITNVMPWRPPQNRDPSPEEAANCLPFLQRHIALVEPKLIILLGAVAVRHVLGHTDGIMRLRGRWDVYQSADFTGAHVIPVMPTLHPAYLLRQPAAKRLAWRDLLSIAVKIDELGLLATPQAGKKLIAQMDRV